MSNLKNMLRWEFLLLYRYKLIHISILTIVLSFLTIQAVESLQGQGQVHSVFLFFDPAIIGIMFVGALVLFEKSEHVLQALVITPMNTDDYILSKVISLTTLSVISATIFMSLLMIFSEISVNVFYFASGIILTSAMMILIGFILASGVQNINGYLLGMAIGFIGLMFPPLLHLFGIIENPIFYIWPTQASFILFDGIFHAGALEIWETIYGIGYQLCWIALLYYFAKKAFYKHIVLKGG
ncbi:MAG: ABC transporter permease [Candidatus Thermoplasmatota archaeon]|nr:ABC transporter permease [Candidatus Thermoplasmatota archaeon]